MDKRLLKDALKKLIGGVVLIWLLLFLPAGTVHYPNAWTLSAVLFIPVVIMGVVLYLKAPELLRKRLREKEQQTEQKSVIAWSGLMFLVGFILAGLDFRFGWTQLPGWISWASAAVFLLGYGMYAEVMRENAYLSRTVEVQAGQKVIDTGLYGVVRHPMYTATILMFLAMPLTLGSLIAFVCFLPYPLLIAARIRNEEAVLETGLEGYADYKRRVKHRLIPFIY